MKARRYGANNTYRGRRGGSAVLKGLIVVLAVLLVVGILSLLLLGRYIEYTDDGVKINVPWLQEVEPSDSPEPAVSDLIVTEAPSASQEPEPEPEPAAAPIGAIEVPVSAILDGTAVELAGDSAIVVTVKDLEGHLSWNSGSELAQNARGGTGESLNGDEAFSEAVRLLAEREEVYLVARLNGFCDLWMCVYDRSMALTTPAGKLWYDTRGMPWLSPANEGARDYLSTLCLELAELGFDEILLDCAGFPESGRLSAIASGENYPTDGLEGAVTKWLEGLSMLLADTDTRLSVQTGKKDLLDCPSGRTAPALLAAYRIWVDETVEIEAWQQALLDTGLEEVGDRLVQIIPASGEEEGEPSGSWAVLQD